MKKIILYIAIIFSTCLFSQTTNEYVRNINQDVLNLIDKYEGSASIQGSNENIFYKIFEREASIYNDIFQSEKFGEMISKSDYIDIVKDGRLMRTPNIDIEVLEMGKISGDENSGTISVIIRKKISDLKFKKIGYLDLSRFDKKLKNKNERINYTNQVIILEFEINYNKNPEKEILKNKVPKSEEEKKEIEDKLENLEIYVCKINSIKPHSSQKITKPIPIIAFTKNFPYISKKGKIIKPDSLQLIVRLNDQKINQEGFNINYFFSEEDGKKFTLNSSLYSRGKKIKQKENQNYKELVFFKRIDYKFSYNLSVNNKNSFRYNLNGNIESLDYNYNENLNVSINFFPIINNIKLNKLNHKLGFKLSHLNSTLNLNPTISNFEEDAQDGEYSYTRKYSINDLNETITINRSNFYITNQIDYEILNNDKLNLFLYSGFNLSFPYLNTASYKTSANVTISGKYDSSQFFEDPTVDYTYLGEGVLDFGTQDVNYEGEINLNNPGFSSSEIYFGIQINYNRIGFSAALHIEPKETNFVDEENNIDYLLSNHQSIESVTSIINNNRFKNTYLSFGINFKL